MELAVIDRMSPNFDGRDGPITMLVLHYTGMQSGAAALQRLRDEASKVSSHYVIEEDGKIHRLVREEDRAWHAGVSCWGGLPALNDCSIGIEIVNPGHEWGYRAFPDVQMQAVETLGLQIIRRWSIPLERVVGHSDIAPTRKEDPGELFDWPRLARAGLSVWPDVANEVDAGRLLDAEGTGALARAMETFGYDLSDFGKALTAFRRRFRPTALSGPPVMRDYLIARELSARYPVMALPSGPVASADAFIPEDV